MAGDRDRRHSHAIPVAEDMTLAAAIGFAPARPCRKPARKPARAFGGARLTRSFPFERRRLPFARHSRFGERPSWPNHEGCAGSKPVPPASRVSPSSGTSPLSKASNAVNARNAGRTSSPSRDVDTASQHWLLPGGSTAAVYRNGG
jgi:hypothetical protein